MPMDDAITVDARRGVDRERHRVIVALAFAPAIAPPRRDRLAARARRALALLCDGAAPRSPVDEPALLVLEAGRRGLEHADAGGAFVRSVGVGGTDWRRARAADGASLLAALRAAGAAALADYTPPFAALFRGGRGAPLAAATDACGVLHVFVTAGADFAACGSSCLALGALGDGGLDLDALARYGRVGLYLDPRTPFADVRRLRPGEVCVLADGRLRVTSWAPPLRREPPFASFSAAVDAGVEVVRAAVGSLAAAHDPLGISLSGGLDSRTILAALPAVRRRALEVLCIDTPGHEDAALVRRLAGLCGFAPTIADVQALPRAGITAAAEVAARRRDCCANPLSAAVLEWAESALPDTPRFNGQNGELARGYFYGRDVEGGVTRERTQALFRDSRFGGAFVAPILAPAYREPVEAALCDEMHDWLAGLGLPWGETLDEVYLRRMAAWVGTELSRTSTRRIDLAPYFDPRFVAFARRVAPRDKHASRVMAAILDAIDPALAALPLDRRPTPAEIGRGLAAPRRPAPPPAGRPSIGPAPVGAAAVRAEVLRDATAGRLELARAAALPLFDAAALAAAIRDASIGVPAFGFALDIECMLAFVEQVRAAPHDVLDRGTSAPAAIDP
jgi:asparagine synthase (glutamine-hydrolysing)